MSSGLLAGALATSVAWPLLRDSAVQFQSAPVQVNVLGKCIFLAAAVAAVAGLILLTWQVVAQLCTRRGRRWGMAVLIDTGIVTAVIPAAVAQAQVFNPHAAGMVPADLFHLLDGMPGLLDWLLLGLAIAVVAQLPTSPDGPDPRPLARRIALPIAVTLLCWYSTWLYLPVAVVIGLALLAWRVLPSKLPGSDQQPRSNGESQDHVTTALRKALAGWRHAEFAAGQRQALSASGTEKLRDLLMEPKPEDYEHRLSALDGAQERLARDRDRWQRNAGQAMADAFSHYGDMPDRKVARQGAIAGAVLGVIPATVTVLTTTPPSPGSGYPVLDFLGGTAWNLFQWPAIGWFAGYYLPLLRGRHGTEKALWLAMASVVAGLPLSIMWDDQHGWAVDLTSDLELLVFLILTCVYVCDLLPLKAAGLPLTYWAQVHNWRFVVTWSTALVAAIGTAAVTFLTVATTDLVNNTLTTPASQSASTSQPSPAPAPSGK